MSTSLIQRFSDVFRREGLRSCWARCMGACGYKRLYLLSRSLHEPLPETRAKIPVHMDWLRPEDEADYEALLTTARDWPLTRRQGAGNRCLTARVDGRLVSVMWACMGKAARIDYLAQDLPLAAHEAYLCGAYTEPAFRGHGIAPAMSVELLRRLREEGITRAIRATWPENTAALRAHAKAGFQPFALMGRVQIGRWGRSFTRPAGPAPA